MRRSSSCLDERFVIKRREHFLAQRRTIAFETEHIVSGLHIGCILPKQNLVPLSVLSADRRENGQRFRQSNSL